MEAGAEGDAKMFEHMGPPKGVHVRARACVCEREEGEGQVRATMSA